MQKARGGLCQSNGRLFNTKLFSMKIIIRRIVVLLLTVGLAILVEYILNEGRFVKTDTLKSIIIVFAVFIAVDMYKGYRSKGI